MKIIQHTPNQLTLDHPLRSAILTCIIGLGFIIQPSITFLSFAYFLGSTSLTCQRVKNKEVNCKLSNSNLLGLVNSKTTYFKNVHSATLGGDGEFQTVFINTTKTQNPLYLYSDIEAKAINKFIDSQEKYLRISQSNWKLNSNKDNLSEVLFTVIIMVIVGLIVLSFISFGVAIVFSPVVKTYIFDIPSASLTIK